MAEVTGEEILRNLVVPSSTGVERIDVEDYVDASGDNALRIWVRVSEATDADQVTGKDVIQLKSGIREQLLKRGETRFPYISIFKASERDAAIAEGAAGA